MDVDSRTTEILNYASMLKKLFAYCIGLTFGCPCNMTTAKLSTKKRLQGIKQVNTKGLYFTCANKHNAFIDQN